jgi:UDP-2,4-diacetamido-2,4,6-trideoxy-beta-L-altropyranose hydrolase
MTQRTILRADATYSAGSGHVRRCITLSHALGAAGWDVALATIGESGDMVAELATTAIDVLPLSGDPAREPQELRAARPGGVDLLIVDHYGRDFRGESACRPWASRIAVIDDLANRRHDADLLVDMTLGHTAADYAGLIDSRTICLMGSDYALLRPEFSRMRDDVCAMRSTRETIDRILVTVGGADQSGAVPQILEALDHAGFRGRADVVGKGVGPQAGRSFQIVAYESVDNMAQLMVEADLAIGACGVTSWERCCLGLPTIAIVTADNQRDIARAISRSGAAILVDPPFVTTIAAAFRSLRDNPAARYRMSKAAAAICDGMGAQRVAAAMTALASVPPQQCAAG